MDLSRLFSLHDFAVTARGTQTRLFQKTTAGNQRQGLLLPGTALKVPGGGELSGVWVCGGSISRRWRSLPASPLWSRLGARPSTAGSPSAGRAKCSSGPGPGRAVGLRGTQGS